MGGRKPNLSHRAEGYLAELGFAADDGAETLFYHTLAVLHSPAYRVENAGALRQDWPRVPLPQTREMLEASAALGRQVAEVLDVEIPVHGVMQGSLREDLQTMAVLTTTEGGAPAFTVNVNWGYFGAGSTFMSTRGRVVESDGQLDVYLNTTTCWRGVPVEVVGTHTWRLSSAEEAVKLPRNGVWCRPLKAEEVYEFMHIGRRSAALLVLNPPLDANYAQTVRA